MLKLKDLFKLDLSSKGGGKLADKIFNKYNITKEERKEIKNEIASGGGGGNSEEGGTWLKVKNWDTVNDIIAMPYITNYYMVSGNGYVGLDVMIMPYSGNYTKPHDFRGVVAIHIAPTIIVMNSFPNDYVKSIKNIEDYFDFAESMGGDVTQLKNTLYDIFEISTQEEIFNHYKEEFNL